MSDNYAYQRLVSSSNLVVSDLDKAEPFADLFHNIYFSDESSPNFDEVLIK